MSLLDQLRASTSPLRRRLDDTVSPARVRGGGEAYHAYLISFDMALSRCWPWLDWQALERLGLPGASERRMRYDFHREQLAARGFPIHPLPDRAAAGDAEAVGTSYVLEDRLDRAWEIHRNAMEPPAAASGRTERLRAELHHWLASLDADEEFVRRACSAACQSLEVFLAAFAVR